MKIGWLEIVLIIFVVIAVVVIARIIRPGRIASQQSNNTRPGTGNSTNRRSGILKRTGIALIAAGGIALIAGVSMLRWVLHNYVLAAILIACGVTIFVISRRKE